MSAAPPMTCCQNDAPGPVAMERVIVADSEWDLATVSGWQDQICDAVDRAGTAVVILDMSAVSFIDSTGLSVLNRARTRSVEQQVRFVLRNPSPRLLRLLALTGMAKVLEIEPVSQPGGS